YDPMVGVIAITTPHLPAVQISEAGGNWLEIWQTGGNNVVGLYQKGLFDNQTFINQYNGFNTAVLYQEGVGSNFAHIEQAGNMAAYIYQVGGGDNKAVVIQH
ncbi:MAG TPA: hypothetical protein VFD91_08005, partial [Mariniphaga sp.]|nr:hypothetical protein [Mariniphaga sp.]